MNREKYHRRSIRLKEYDYSRAGAYCVTICTQNRECILGEIINGEMVLNDFGKYAQQCWQNIPNHFPHAISDVYCIMPNHIHGIIVLAETGKAGNTTETVETGNTTETVGAKNFSPIEIENAPEATNMAKNIDMKTVRAINFHSKRWVKR